MSNSYEIGPVVITAYKEQTYSTTALGGGGYGDDFGNSAIGRKVAANAKKEVSEKYKVPITNAVAAQEANYAAKRLLIPKELQKKSMKINASIALTRMIELPTCGVRSGPWTTFSHKRLSKLFHFK